MDFSQFVGLPWRERGRAADGCDCWGLVALVYRQAGVELPSFAEAYASTADREAIASLVDGRGEAWVSVERGRERMLDCALMLIGGGYHIGVTVRRGLLLHMPRGQSSVIEPSARFERVVEGLYRHTSLAER